MSTNSRLHWWQAVFDVHSLRGYPPLKKVHDHRSRRPLRLGGHAVSLPCGWVSNGRDLLEGSRWWHCAPACRWQKYVIAIGRL